MATYSYNRVAQRALDPFFEPVQQCLGHATQCVEVGRRYLEEVQELYAFLRIKERPAAAEALVRGAQLLVQEIPVVLAGISQLEGELDAYAARVRGSKPSGQTLRASDLDSVLLKEFKARARKFKSRLGALARKAETVPNDFELEDYGDSGRIAEINELANKLSELSVDLAFDASDLVDFLDNVEDNVLDRVND